MSYSNRLESNFYNWNWTDFAIGEIEKKWNPNVKKSNEKNNYVRNNGKIVNKEIIFAIR